MMSFPEYLKTRKAAIDSVLPTYIERLNAPKIIKESMLYSLNAGGKRLRPMLLLAVLHSYGKEEKIGYPVACAVELIHTYSLIHDDLPCMDNDDFRRGKPTNHKVYGEAIAVLAGDGLLTESFRLIADAEELSDRVKLTLISELSKAAGAEGMVGGQVADMEGENKQLTLKQLEYIHEHKTAKLLAFSIIAGAIIAEASIEEINKLKEFAYHIGIAFQIKDDILDVEGDEEKIGKPVGSDEENKKTTYLSVLSLEGAKKKLSEHIETSKAILQTCSINNELLLSFCNLIGEREH